MKARWVFSHQGESMDYSKLAERFGEDFARAADECSRQAWVSGEPYRGISLGGVRNDVLCGWVPEETFFDSHGNAWTPCSPEAEGAEAFGPLGTARSVEVFRRRCRREDFNPCATEIDEATGFEWLKQVD